MQQHIGTARLIASITTLAALGACMSGSGTGSMGGTGSAGTPGASVGSSTGGATGTTTGTTATPVVPTNTGDVAPAAPVDTAPNKMNPPTGAANSTVGTGTGVAALGGGLTGKAAGAVAVPGNLITNIGSDARIVSAIDVVNTDEIAAAMLAREKATSPRVRAFAEQMITDHTRLQGADRALASESQFISSDSAGVTLEMRRNDRAAMVRLQAMSRGQGFDAAYIRGEIDDHKQALALFNAAKPQARDGRVSDLITMAIPVLQQHLNDATAIQASMGPM
ncbi:MAG: DUF4142 domain-containing protein [Gemmatimonadaceae bacterium]